MAKKTKKVEKETEKPNKTKATAETRIEYFARLENQAEEPLKKLEFRFWKETAEGKNPEVPAHMR